MTRANKHNRLQTSSRPSWTRCKPSLFICQDYEKSYGKAAVAFAKMCGVELLDWQQEMLDVYGAYKIVDGKKRFVHNRCAACIPRQAGKSEVMIIWASFLACFLGYSVLWTEHNYSTACDMLRRFRRIFGEKKNDSNARYPLLNEQVANTTAKTAQEAIFFKPACLDGLSEGKIVFSTRTKTANLGYTFDVIFYDEAQSLTLEHEQALLPTTSSSPSGDSQFVYTGTPVRAGTSDCVFEVLHEEAKTQPDDDLAFVEYGIGECTDEEVGLRDTWLKVNPSLGLVANEVSIKSACNQMSKSGVGGILAFKQEYLGYWLPKVASSVVSERTWQACKVEKVTPLGKRTLGIKFSPDRSSVALAGCTQTQEGVPFVELLAYEPMSKGLSWLAQTILQRKGKYAAIAIDGMSGAPVLFDRLDGHVPKNLLLSPKAGDVIEASAMMLDAIESHAIAHSGQSSLDMSVCTATKRAIGKNGGWGWQSEQSAPIEAVSLALWAQKKAKRDIDRKQKVL